MRYALITLIKAYRYGISPLLGHHCRFHPSCSSYAQAAIERFGLIQGVYLGTRRLIKCHPWHEGGIDPVPNQSNKK